MRRLPHLSWPAVLVLMVLLAGGGCKRAKTYGPAPGIVSSGPSTSVDRQPPTVAEQPQPLDNGLQWLDRSNPREPLVGTSIELVHAEKAPAEWNKLTKFWTQPGLSSPSGAAALIGLPPLTAGSVLAGQGTTVRIKVPLGLPDPGEYIPAGNPLTLEKWYLGRKLFFDDGYLSKEHKVSCAGCHQPDHGFAGVKRGQEAFDAPSLVNCVFNSYQFWDGRATRLEEVVQRTLEDEREPQEVEPFRHVWHGVIGRLRDRSDYRLLFERAFGTLPTQDAVGRAIATYLRTLLAGGSLFDRAVEKQQKRHAAAPEAADFLAALRDSDLAELEADKAKKEQLADRLFRGHQLFFGRDPKRQTHCIRCHLGRTFSDGEFHNLGVRFLPPRSNEPLPGRFAHVPLGQKDRYLIGAYKTPTLRGLDRTAPYFHDGEKATLREVVQFYNDGGNSNDYQDPELHLPNESVRQLHLEESDIDALVLFLRALNGDEVDSSVRKPPPESR